MSLFVILAKVLFSGTRHETIGCRSMAATEHNVLGHGRIHVPDVASILEIQSRKNLHTEDQR